MQLYQFEKIYSQMENEFGKVRKGDKEVMKLMLQENEVSELTPNVLKDYYKLPVMCLLRIKDAIETLEQN